MSPLLPANTSSTGGPAKPRLTPSAAPEEPTIVRIEDASSFVQQMAVMEGQIRLGMMKCGCNCKMDVCGKIIHSTETDCVVSVFTMHEPICGFAQKLKLSFPELDEDDDVVEAEPR